METKKVEKTQNAPANENTAALVQAINKNEVTEEQFQACKQIAFNAMQKLLSGEKVSADEVAINSFVARAMQKVKTQAEKQAENAAKKAEAEAVYKREMQEYKNKLIVFIKDFAKQIVADATTFETSTDVKGYIREAFVTLPKEPKKPGNRNRKGTESNNDYSNPEPVKKIAEGSTNWHIERIFAGGEGFTKKEVLEALKLACPQKSETTLQLTLNRAINGRLPIISKGDQLFWKAKEPAEEATKK